MIYIINRTLLSNYLRLTMEKADEVNKGEVFSLKSASEVNNNTRKGINVS